MRRSIRKFNIPPGQPPGHPPGIWTFEDWLVQIPSSRGKNAPPTSTEITLLKDKFRLQSNTVHAFQSEICRNDTFQLLLKELLTNKGEILSWKSVIPCKNRKNSRAYYVRTRDNPVQTPHPFNATFKSPPPRARCTVKCLGYARGGCWSFELIGALHAITLASAANQNSSFVWLVRFCSH